MKKLLSVILLAGFTALISCGPSAEEKAAMEKAKQDSIATVQKAIDDSIAAVNAAAAEKAKADSMASAEMDKARQDSMDAMTKKLKGFQQKAKKEEKMQKTYEQQKKEKG